MSEPGGSFRVPPEISGVRLDVYLSSRFPGESRSQIQKWIRDGSVLLNNSPVKTGCRLKPGDLVSIQLKAQPAENLPRPENIPLSILYEDDDLAVVEKPAGMVSHGGAGVRSGTLVNALLFHLGPFQTGDPSRPGIVHRLDKLTSGLLVVAKNAESHRILSRKFRDRRVKKEYLALVYGHPSPPMGTVNLALGRDFRDRKKISVHSRRRREAVTHYFEEKRVGPFSLLRVRIETGRTHQIRVHLAQIGHPVAGDQLYGGHRLRNVADPILRTAILNLKRQFLHAYRLEFDHPRTGSNHSFTSPLPAELAGFLDLVSQASA